jgi:2-polyprenyl-3-methyl-5-hydroxy-6-metoxy-1,4-benzoquinol methylase
MTNDKIDAIERIKLANDPDVPIVVIREHLIRYVLALESIVGKNVLDIACGTGYGMYLMSFLAKSVSGYDYDQEAINEAKKFPYHCDCCLEIRNLEEDKPLGNHKHKEFDVVTCFETIEHVINPEVLLKNIKEATGKGGVVYISTPNDLKKTDKNKWHKVHFDFFSLFNIIKEKMNNPKVTMYGADQWGVSDDVTKPYVVAKIEL